MDGKTRSGYRRARFVDDDRPRSNSTGNDGGSIFRSTSTIAVHAVLHGAAPDLGPNESRPGIAEPSATLANLTDEFNDLTRKMALLKETLKVKRNIEPKRTVQTNCSSQANQVADLSDIGIAKLVVLDCISELTLVNHFLDGSEETASLYRDKLRHAFSGQREKSESIVIEGLSVSPTNLNTAVGGLVADSAAGAAEPYSNRNKREAEVQTEVSETSMNRNIAKSQASLKIIDEVRQKSSQQDEMKKNKRWYSCCAVGKRGRKKRPNEKTPGKSSKASSSKRSTVKPPEKSSTKVVICEDVS